MSEADSVAFLRERNYYDKIQAFEGCFSRYGEHAQDRIGKYVNLDFAYLAELTRLDHLLRDAVMSMSLDVEHYMKVAISRSVMDAGVESEEVVRSFFDADRERKGRVAADKVDLAAAVSCSEEAYELVSCLGLCDRERVASAAVSLLHLSSRLLDGTDPGYLERSLMKGRDSSYSRSLTSTVKSGEPMTVGYYLELATFGGVTALYKHWFYDVLDGSDKISRLVKQLLFPTRTLRNASAHNSNVLDTLGRRLSKPIGSIAAIARDIYGVDTQLVALTRRFPIVHDFTALLRCHDLLVAGSDSRSDAATRLSGLAERFSRHREYFAKQAELASGLLVLSELMSAGSQSLLSH